MPGLSAGLDPGALFAPLERHHRIGLAVSGGADSLALMLLATAYAEATDSHARFVVYSLDHGLRREAADEVAFVLDLARRRGLAARGLRWEGAKPETGLQDAARRARYRLFAAAMAQDRAEVLVTAHHLGDQAETVMMRLAHGSGIEGLRGMDETATIEGAHVARPLLGVHPAALRALVEQAGLVPVADPSNDNAGYERVRWRRILSSLAELGLDARRIGLFAARMRDAEAALAAMAGAAMTRVELEPGGTRATISRAVIDGLPRAVLVRLLGRVLEIVGSGRKPHALAAVEALADRLSGGDTFRSTLRGCVVSARRTTVGIAREPGRRTSVGGEEPTRV